MKKRVGVVSTWFARGSGQIAKQIIQAINWHTDYEIALLARMSIADGRKQLQFWGEYFFDNILLHHTYQISDDDFEQWIIANKLDVVVFVEEQHTKNLLPICNKLGIKSINYIVWENFNPAELSYYKQSTYLVCPTKSSYNLLKNDYMLDNTVYVPWGVDLDTYQFQEPIKKDKPYIFFPAGFGGVSDRKNEDAVIKTFTYICPRDKMNLHIHTQKEGQAGQAQGIVKTSGTIDNNQLLQYYKEADIIVLPSRWEGNGLPFIEASAYGRPIVTVDSPPMNERVINGFNGFTCKVIEMKEIQGVFVKSAEIDCWDFAEKLILLEDRDLLYSMQIASRKYAEQELNWFTNSKKLIDILT